MYDIITFGSAAKDTNVKSGSFKVIEDPKDFEVGQGICLPLGAKIDVDHIEATFGGGGMNTAAGFAKQGFKVAFCGAIGADEAGRSVVQELKRLRVDTKLVQINRERATNQSVVISQPTGDRTILVYRGAAEQMGKDAIPFKKLKAKWIYLAPLSGLLCDNFKELVDFANTNKIFVAANPSKQQLSLPKEVLLPTLGKLDMLFLNQEEASLLTGVPFAQSDAIFKELIQWCRGVVVMTMGGEGVMVSDGKNKYTAKPNDDRKIVDTTGAGDSLASGFLSAYMREGGNIEKAIQLGLANSEANLARLGAQTGLLMKGEAYKTVMVQKTTL